MYNWLSFHPEGSSRRRAAGSYETRREQADGLAIVHGWRLRQGSELPARVTAVGNKLVAVGPAAAASGDPPPQF
jgi:hypothetical protein